MHYTENDQPGQVLGRNSDITFRSGQIYRLDKICHIVCIHPQPCQANGAECSRIGFHA